MTTYRAAVAVLQRCLQAMETATADGRAAIREQHDAALAVIDAALPKRQRDSARIAEQISRLETQMLEMTAGERLAAICARLKISPATYYRLRNSHSHENGD